MAKKSPVGTKLGAIAKKLAKTKPDKAYPLLYEAFTYVAASGDVARATQLVDWMYGGRVPRPEEVATAISTPALDAFCAAAAIGDRTKGEPTWPATTEPRPPLEARARDAGRLVRWRTMNDRYEGNRLAREQWRALPSTDPWRRINQWRDIQEAAAPTPEEIPVRTTPQRSAC